MPCSLCENYFIYNPCTEYDRIPFHIKEHIKRLVWFKNLKPNCPCKECIVGLMCSKQQSLKCEAYKNTTYTQLEKVIIMKTEMV